jgi:hypothetical protein
MVPHITQEYFVQKKNGETTNPLCTIHSHITKDMDGADPPNWDSYLDDCRAACAAARALAPHVDNYGIGDCASIGSPARTGDMRIPYADLYVQLSKERRDKAIAELLCFQAVLDAFVELRNHA